MWEFCIRYLVSICGLWCSLTLEFVIDGDMKAQLTNTLDMSSKKMRGGEKTEVNLCTTPIFSEHQYYRFKITVS